MRKKTMILIALLFMGMVILPGFSMSNDGSGSPTMGCGNVSGDLDDWLDDENVAHVYFHQADPFFEGKNNGEAWAKMSYTFCGAPSRFVFNGKGLEDGMPYALIASPVIPDMFITPTAPAVPLMLGEAMSNDGGNVHIKGQLPEYEVTPWDLYLVRADDWEAVILAADEPITWTPECDTDVVCDEGVLMAELSGDQEVPPVMTQAAGSAVFYDSGTGNQLAFILKASDAGTVTSARIHYGAVGSNGPAVADLFTGSDDTGDFLTAGMIMEAGLIGDFAGSPVSALIAAMDDGMTYVNLHTEAWPSGELRGQIARIDISGICHDDDDGCMEDCLEECLEDYPEVSMETCKDECKEVCD